eukprot:TRINITY_DN9292_c0_g2_i1.p1 TRINITY_DN9292_c0_g2~~TRINITY_DN9292_c0_g2_i1.p1  ORF type:complete len:432 (+),score=59.89 TRINITY_DN9292_c0_g2_i1:286-1581(+)
MMMSSQSLGNMSQKNIVLTFAQVLQQKKCKDNYCQKCSSFSSDDSCLICDPTYWVKAANYLAIGTDSDCSSKCDTSYARISMASSLVLICLESGVCPSEPQVAELKKKYCSEDNCQYSCTPGEQPPIPSTFTSNCKDDDCKLCLDSKTDSCLLCNPGKWLELDNTLGIGTDSECDSNCNGLSNAIMYLTVDIESYLKFSLPVCIESGVCPDESITNELYNICKQYGIGTCKLECIPPTANNKHPKTTTCNDGNCFLCSSTGSECYVCNDDSWMKISGSTMQGMIMGGTCESKCGDQQVKFGLKATMAKETYKYEVKFCMDDCPSDTNVDLIKEAFKQYQNAIPDVKLEMTYSCESGGFPWWAILLIVLAVVVVLGIVIYLCWQKQRKRREMQAYSYGNPASTSNEQLITSTHQLIKKKVFQRRIGKLGFIF